ncbi:MAG: hypothetical protein IJ709_10650 [Selenomonas sp.]|nr:hypothetical protein [Selenomonas sp.]
MMYEVNEEERARIQEGIDYLFNDDTASGQVDFTGSSISPYNIKQVLIDNGFTDEIYDRYHNWWYFKHPELGTAVIDFNAECFALKLYKDEER